MKQILKSFETLILIKVKNVDDALNIIAIGDLDTRINDIASSLKR